MVIQIQTVSPLGGSVEICLKEPTTVEVQDLSNRAISSVLHGWNSAGITVTISFRNNHCFVDISLQLVHICPTKCFGHGTCVADGLCQCNPPFYDDCSKSCLQGYITPDGKSCISKSETKCIWSEWSDWTACSDTCSSSNIQTRSQTLLNESSSSSCPPTNTDNAACTKCFGFDPEVQAQIQKEAVDEVSKVAFSLLFYMSSIGDSLSTLYGCTLTQSPTSKQDALMGVFKGSITTLGNQTSHQKRSLDSTNESTTAGISDINTSTTFTDNYTIDTSTTDNSSNISDTESNFTCITDPQQLENASKYVIDTGKQFLVDSQKIDPSNIKVEHIPPCQIALTVQVPSPSILVYVLPPVAVVLLTLIALIAVIIWKSIPINMKVLPEEVRWQFQNFLDHPGEWAKVINHHPNYYRKSLVPKSPEWNRMQDIFDNFSDASPILKIKEVYAIYNEILLQSFVNQYKIMVNRVHINPTLFNKFQWKNEKRTKEREIVHDYFCKRKNSILWNDDQGVSILPLLHGTSYPIACSIASSGFAILSSLDAGWYGKGIYFTSYAKYCVPYISNRKDPAMLISYVIMGNTYPIIEQPTDPDSFMGAAMKAGYNSHYIVVSSKGTPAQKQDFMSPDGVYDEIVIPLESQIVPAYILRFLPFDSENVIKNWRRKEKSEKVIKSSNIFKPDTSSIF
eukprot:TRINITY_DN9528_c0_g1_i1.p1 TRINITY_DN9528_c0_g1~~TRINITY_DN9528_c0_g1_i1.p1  ORF type:complete len:709 (-),score=117.87 TRINITY_DN9528_c0_g1_i1:263-2305(-)